MDKHKFFFVFTMGMITNWLFFLVVNIIFPSPFKETELYLKITHRHIAENYPEKLPSMEKFQYGAIKGFVRALHDPYSVFLTPEEIKTMEANQLGSFFGLGVNLHLPLALPQIIGVDSGGAAYEAGLRKNDYIFSIDGEKTKNLSDTEIIAKLRSDKDDSVKVVILRENAPGPLKFSLKRKFIQLEHQQTSLRIINKIAIIKYPQFESNQTINFLIIANQLSQNDSLKGIILDLRNNPGGQVNLCQMIASCWLKREELLAVVINQNEKKENLYPLALTLPLEQNEPPLQKFKTIVLVNAYSASASELLSGALQDHRRATIVGAKTLGKGSIQLSIPLKAGRLIITQSKYFTPHHRPVDGVGILPDISVANQPGDTTDLALEKAIALITKSH